MNNTVPSATNWPEDDRKARLRAKKSGLRMIDRGTRYDVPGMLRRLARQIERGEHGRVTDCAGAVRYVDPCGCVGSFGFHAGTDSTEAVSYILRRYATRLES